MRIGAVEIFIISILCAVAAPSLMLGMFRLMSRFSPKRKRKPKR
ncbi:MAG: hypothetical protein AAF653_19490 [Chloroflexota bacterium]